MEGCVHVRMYACMYVRTYVCLNVCWNVCMYVFPMNVDMYLSVCKMCASIYILVRCIYTSVYKCMLVCEATTTLMISISFQCMHVCAGQNMHAAKFRCSKECK